jgi:hypothetical protein
LAILAAVPWRTRGLTAGRVAAAGLGLVVAAQAAAAVAPSRTDDRDAVRLLGRPAVRLPGFRVEGRVSGEWTPEGLGWGSLYEPHRQPEGAEVGRRLPLPAGRYRLVLEGEPLSPDRTFPPLVVSPDRPGAPDWLSPVRPGSSGWEADFDVRRSERAVTLRLRGGGPILLKRLKLSVQPAGTGPV